MRALLTAILLSAGLASATPAAAQYSDRYEFFKAVKSGDAAKAMELMGKPGSTLAQQKDRDDGKTGLHISTERLQPGWINLMIDNGADVNAQDDDGDSALMIAAASGFTDGVRLLLYHKANVNLANRRGETPLIRAVQQRDLDIIRLLLAAGADPDQRDSFAGLSAREYAARDRRAARVLELIENNGKDAGDDVEVSGPSL